MSKCFSFSHLLNSFDQSGYENQSSYLELMNLGKTGKICPELPHIIVYGPPGVGKYSVILQFLKMFSPSGLKYEKKQKMSLQRDGMFIKLSDIHFEVDMYFLIYNSRMLWQKLFDEIVTIITSKPKKEGFIVCTNFHEVNPELMEIFYHYLQSNCIEQSIQIKFILHTESISFFSSFIVDSCFVCSIARPSKEFYKNQFINEKTWIHKQNQNPFQSSWSVTKRTVNNFDILIKEEEQNEITKKENEFKIEIEMTKEENEIKIENEITKEENEIKIEIEMTKEENEIKIEIEMTKEENEITKEENEIKIENQLQETNVYQIFTTPDSISEHLRYVQKREEKENEWQEFIKYSNISNIINMKTIHQTSFHIHFSNLLMEMILSEKSFSSSDFLDFRNKIYDLLIFNVDIHATMFTTLQTLIRNNHISQHFFLSLLSSFFRCIHFFNNNYRNIFHLEKLFCMFRHFVLLTKEKEKEKLKLLSSSSAILNPKLFIDLFQKEIN